MSLDRRIGGSCIRWDGVDRLVVDCAGFEVDWILVELKYSYAEDADVDIAA